MADVQEVPGQATGQPAHAIFQQDLNPSDAVGILAQALEAEDKGEPLEQQKLRDDKTGKFVKAEKAAEAKPETEAAQAEETKPEEQEKQEAKPEETEAEPEQKPTLKLKLKYKGEEKEIEGEDAVTELAQKGYDYTQKMQALAKEREEAQAKVKAEIESARQKYEQQLEVQRQAISKLSGVKSMADIETLAKTDPTAAQQEFLRLISVNQAIQAIEAEQAKVTQQKQSEAQESYQKQAREAVEKLQERIPGWNNDLYGKILKGAVDKYGFQQQEVNAITDHRAIEVLNDALKWREYQAAKPKTVEKRVASVPKVQKPGTAEKPNPDANRLKGAMAQFQKSGSRQDAQDVFRELIEAGRL